MFKYLKQFLCLLVVCNFLLMVSGVHGAFVSDNHAGKSEHNQCCNDRDEEQSNSDCPCIFHTKGVISDTSYSHVGFSFLYMLEQQPAVLAETIISTEAFFSWGSRGPPSFI